MVPSQDGGERLEPERPRPPDQERPLRQPGKGGNKPPMDPSPAPVRSGCGDPEGPLQLRLPEPGGEGDGGGPSPIIAGASPGLSDRAWGRVRLCSKQVSLKVGS